MNITFVNVLEINVLLISLVLIYLTVKDKLSFNSRRLLIMSIPLMSFVSYFIKLNFIAPSNVITSVVHLDLIEVSSINKSIEFNNLDLKIVYLIGLILFLIYTSYKILKILFLFKNPATIKRSKYYILKSKQEKSFSFFNFIHLSAHLAESENNIVLEHEIIHCEKKHSLDIIIMEIYHAIFWYNPFMFILKNELNHVHEYQVDSQMFKKYNTSYIKHLLAYTLRVESTHFLLTSQFNNQLTLAKRTKIMKKKVKKSKLLLLTLPVFVIIFSLVSCTKEIKNEIPIQLEITKNADVYPVYKEGGEALNKFIASNIKYPESAISSKIEGKVYVSFIVLSNGKIGEVKILRGVNEAIDNESLRVVKLMGSWIPGEKNGKKVNVKQIIPINFKLD